MFSTLMSLEDRLRLKLKVKTLCMAIMLYHPWQSRQVNSNLERDYRDCIKSRRDKIGITRHIMMHQVLYNVHVTLFMDYPVCAGSKGTLKFLNHGQLHNIYHLVHHDIPCDPNLVSSAFYIYNSYTKFSFTCLLSFFCCF